MNYFEFSPYGLFLGIILVAVMFGVPFGAWYLYNWMWDLKL